MQGSKGPQWPAARRRRVSRWPPPIGGGDVAEVATLIQNNSGPSIGLAGRSMAGLACGEPTLEGEVQNEAARIHHPARRRGGDVAARGARAAAGDAGPRVSERQVASRV